MSSNPPEPTVEQEPSDFLGSLVDAMRRVVETTRDRTLAEMREAVETEAGQLDLARAARESTLRERAEAEIAGVSSWEHAEIERIRAEALRKVQARGGQLDQELAQLSAANTAEHAALTARAEAYEREVSEFIAGLEAIKDPAAFAAAARRMPPPWSAKPAPSATPTVATSVAPMAPPATAMPAEPAPTGTAAAPELATSEPGVGESAAAEPMKPAEAPTNGVASATDAASADVVPAEPVAPEPVAPQAEAAEAVAPEPEPVADQTTPIQVHGLGSFGAITSFKQSLEKVEGVRSVTLGLGPSGEFIYTATHSPAFDLTAAIRAIEGEGVQIERGNGTLKVRVGKVAPAG